MGWDGLIKEIYQTCLFGDEVNWADARGSEISNIE